MVEVKNIELKVIPAKIANDFVRKTHYSGKVATTSQLHFGCYYKNVLHGVISYGAPMSKHKVISLVGDGTSTKNESWNRMLELNRMAFDDTLPKNSESRCLAISFKLLKKNAPHIDWILSFSDATASGDGTIYRAVGFELTQITPNKSILILPSGERVASLTITNGNGPATKKRLCKELDIPYYSAASVTPILDAGAKWANGFQLRYIKRLNPKVKLNCKLLSYDDIDKAGAGMLRGERITRKERQGQ